VIRRRSLVRRQHRDPLHDARERGHRLATRPQRDHFPAIARLLERRPDARANERRLAAARCTDHRRQRLFANARHHARDLAAAPEEAIRVGLLKRSQTQIRTLAVAQRAAVPAGQQLLEPRDDGARIRNAIGLRLAQAVVDDVRQDVWHAGHEVAHRATRLGRQQIVDERIVAQRMHRVLARQHLEHDHAERPQVRAVIDGVDARLLRRHIRERADERAFARQHHRARRRARQILLARSILLAAHRLRDAEVEHLHLSADGHDHVLRLEIAVRDAERVRAFECTRDRQHELDDARRRDAVAVIELAHQLAQLLALEELEHHERDVLELVDLVDDDDVVVTALRRRARLDEEPIDNLARAGAQELHRDAPPELEIARGIDDAHAAAPELADQLVLLDARAGRKLGRIHHRRVVGFGRRQRRRRDDADRRLHGDRNRRS
jgi:hypothetical protein